MLPLSTLRHSAEHVLHQAIKELWPETVLDMGPATDEGFYCDFDPNGAKILEADFPRIEKRMKRLIQANLPIARRELSVKEARELFAGNPYKLDWIDGIEAKGEKVTVYWTGKPGEKGSMVDLCAGPHLNSTGEVKAFKLLSMAGAYWHGDEKNKMLTRIYGTAFASQAELDEYVRFQEEVKKRDHRKLGKELGLFTFSQLVGSGLPLWTPKGTLLRNVLDEFVWQLRQAKGYQKVTIPHITKKDLYETSGHWAKFANDLFRIKTREGHDFAMKPMNCPHHTQIYNSVQRSYRDLPQRYCETTMVYRDEQTGELNGLSRVRCITQDDAHVFCRETQLKDEFFAIWDIIDEFYQATGFPQLKVRLSLSDPHNMKAYLGTKEQWQLAEQQLRDFAQARGVEYFEAVGEAAFYGPKIDFIAQDSLKRDWQVATIQADRNMPASFKLTCTNEQGEKEQVVMVHAAIMGSIERFLAILIQHYAGWFPVWMAPEQIRVLPIADRHHHYAKGVSDQLKAANLRVSVDDRSESLPAKIRASQLDKIPFVLVVGDKEEQDGTVAVRRQDGSEAKPKQEVLKVGQLVTKITQLISEHH